jgi:glycogen debranching enzyme
VAVFSKHGMKVFTCIFEGESEQRHELSGRDGDVHFAFIKGLKAGARYGFRVEGPWATELGLRFDPSKLLTDPFAWALDRSFTYHESLTQRGVDTAALVPKCVAMADLPDVQRLPFREPKFIYELSAKAFTKLHPDVPDAKRGTIAALGEAVVIDHLKSVGADTVELMPIAAWIDERHLNPLGLRNAWGYNPVQFFAPDPRLAPGGMVEIREAVAKLHQHNIRIILDVVLNHSGESDQFGPTLCFRGVDSPLYYAHARGELINDTGCGNTIALNEPHVVDMVVAALRHWVLKAGVDGFRFDLATVMGRTADGFHADAPLLKAIESDPVLSTCIMIAEPWDVGRGGYQLGHFPSRWLEWNDRYRDDIRKFWRGDDFSANHFATRLTGSSDIFGERRPSNSINFIAAHDGFTLLDLVNYADKNNFNNGENNRDGKSNEVTWTGGNVFALLATLLLSRGTTLLTAGDEFGRTQHGNNNAYAQDNEITWLNWKDQDRALIAEIQKLRSVRQDFSAFFENEFLSDKRPPTAELPDADWFGADGKPIDWSQSNLHFVGLALAKGSRRIAVVANASEQDLEFSYVARKGFSWRLRYQSAHQVPRNVQCAAKSVSVFEETSLHRKLPQVK